jgi:predicted nucleotidyltransferase
MKELLDYQILKLQNGSKLYGTNTPASDDDYVAIFTETPDLLFSGRKADSIPLHDRGPNERNFDAEVDGIAYPLRHFIKLALDGNPSILCLLFAQDEHKVFENESGKQLLDNKELFLSQKAGPKFLGYMNSQLQRMKGEKKGHIPSRPEIVEKFGYDTKYAMQVARLALQGIEYLRDGVITLPMEEHKKRTLIDIRYGVYTFSQCLAYLDELENQLKTVIDSGKSPLPLEPNYSAVYTMSRTIHEREWRKNCI